ncbi:putative homoserine dehydrogenase, Aspartate kinase [Lupinus albus]|uniref:Putative homoserine dehydrogenase, Aspartate kinase n=1 Tax=Lupinus albus TaxID=3870 RepID=A0A6A4QDX8_LUPAL|nr:putative homoserine dehydrogenase, Aspartate kinase [Lupinus albus]
MARALQLCGVNGNVYVTERISMNCETGIGFGKFVRAGLCSARGVVVSSEKMTSLLSVTCKATGTKSDVIEKKNNVIVENDENFGEIERSSSYTCVMKFGGSSVASAERMREVAALILSFPQERPIIVLSAMGKTTNKLLMSVDLDELHGDWVSDPAIPIVTGFLGKARKSCAVTTLGRGGSDLTATTIGKALGLPEIQVWKDVDGVLTCDPNICPQATPVPYLTFDEAAELAYFGAQKLKFVREKRKSVSA